MAIGTSAPNIAINDPLLSWSPPWGTGSELMSMPKGLRNGNKSWRIVWQERVYTRVTTGLESSSPEIREKGWLYLTCNPSEGLRLRFRPPLWRAENLRHRLHEPNFSVANTWINICIASESRQFLSLAWKSSVEGCICFVTTVGGQLSWIRRLLMGNLLPRGAVTVVSWLNNHDYVILKPLGTALIRVCC